MQKDTEKLKCPFCGSSSGVFITHSTEYMTAYTWEGKLIDTEQTGNGECKKRIRCLECQKTINRYLPKYWRP